MGQVRYRPLSDRVFGYADAPRRCTRHPGLPDCASMAPPVRRRIALRSVLPKAKRTRYLIRLPCVRPASGEDAWRTHWQIVDGRGVTFYRRAGCAYRGAIRDILFVGASPTEPAALLLGNPPRPAFGNCMPDGCDAVSMCGPARPGAGRGRNGCDLAEAPQSDDMVIRDQSEVMTGPCRRLHRRHRARRFRPFRPPPGTRGPLAVSGINCPSPMAPSCERATGSYALSISMLAW